MHAHDPILRTSLFFFSFSSLLVSATIQSQSPHVCATRDEQIRKEEEEEEEEEEGRRWRRRRKPLLIISSSLSAKSRQS
jgi:hypothetical protein